MAKDERLLRTSEARLCSFNLPVVVSERLDQLVDLVEGEGLLTSRKDLVAALVMAASADSAELLRLSLSYNKAKISGAAPRREPDGTLLEFERPKPGRRPRRLGAARADAPVESSAPDDSRLRGAPQAPAQGSDG